MSTIEQLRALYWAEIHMREARDASRHLIEVAEIGEELTHAIYTGIVVCYTRSFGKNKGLLQLGKEFSNFNDQKLQKLHKHLLDARNSVYAHKDINKESKKLTDVEDRDSLQKIAIHIDESGDTQWQVNRPALLTTDLIDIIALCEIQIERMNRASGDMLQNFCKGKSFNPGNYILGESLL